MILGVFCPGGYLYATLFVKERISENATFLGKIAASLYIGSIDMLFSSWYSETEEQLHSGRDGN